MYGIIGLELYFPKTFVSQRAYQIYSKVAQGKITKGLGQEKMAFTYEFQDVNSISLTVVHNLMRRYKIDPMKVGRLEVGTQTLQDKSKSTKTIIMELFKNNNDIQGATSLNACYGGTNALINTLNWMSSSYWDGKFGIVVCADLAVYEDGPARPTGGAGAVAILLGPNPAITFQNSRASHFENSWDFYKPNPFNQFPVVDGKVSISLFTKSLLSCYKKLCLKTKKNELLESNYMVFHAPFAKMVRKSFDQLLKYQFSSITQKQLQEQFDKKVSPSTKIPKNIGNIYTGSVYAGLISLLTQKPNISQANCLMFSYGSGSASTMMKMRIHKNPLDSNQINQIKLKLQKRIEISPEDYTKVMLSRQTQYGLNNRQIDLIPKYLWNQSFYLKNIDQKWRRRYHFLIEIQQGQPVKRESEKEIQLDLNTIQSISKKSNQMSLQAHKLSAMMRLQNLNSNFNQNDVKKASTSFKQLNAQQKQAFLSQHYIKPFNFQLLRTGGLNTKSAQKMIENVIGKLALPFAIVPYFSVNKQQYFIPMSVQQPSVVAGCSLIAKLIRPYSFRAQSTESLMRGQIHLPNLTERDHLSIMEKKDYLLQRLSSTCIEMNKRGGGVVDLLLRKLSEENIYSLDIIVNVCQAMGANSINSLVQFLKKDLNAMGIKTGIGILSNFCIERKARSSFLIPVKDLAYKGQNGVQIAQKIVQAYQFAVLDKFRAVTHNKGVMNGISSVCLATGQDCRAVQASCHAYACQSGRYLPLTKYSIQNSNGELCLKGEIQIPISIGTVGGVLSKNQLYKLSLQIMNNPSSRQLAQIIASVGLAQNLAALRALCTDGIQKGHMKLHNRFFKNANL